MAILVRMIAAFFGLFASFVVIFPFFLPVPKAAIASPAKALADPDSRFVEFDGLTVHYKMAGEGGPLFILLHGFLGSTENWRTLSAELAMHGTVLAYDRPGFGLTERPSTAEWGEINPYTSEAQIELLNALIRHAGHERAILVGNSAGGTVAMQTALASPERVEALVLVAPAVYGLNGTPGWFKPVLATPQAKRVSYFLMHQWLGNHEVDLLSGAYHNPSHVTAADIERNRRFTRTADWDRALWDFTMASRHIDLTAQFERLTVPTLIITGDNDRVVRTEFSLRLADELPGAQLAVLPDCGHLPQEECPDATLQAIVGFLGDLPAGSPLP